MASITSDRAVPARRFSLKRLTAMFEIKVRRRQDTLDYEHLLRMDDHMLKDMGLSVDEVKQALLTTRSWL